MGAKEQAQIDQDLNNAIGKIQQVGGYSDEQRANIIQALRARAAQLKQEDHVADPVTNGVSDFEHGGVQGYTAATVAKDNADATAAGMRPGISADYGQANADRTMGLVARGSETDALGMYKNAAMGLGPSAAQSQFQHSLDQSEAANTAMGNSARGGSLNLSQAQGMAMNTNAQMNAAATSTAAALRAQEQQAGMAGYAGLGATIRGQDYQGQGLDVGMANSQAGFALSSRAGNDALELAYKHLAAGEVTAEDQMQLAHEAAMKGASDAQIQQFYAAEAAARAAQDKNAGIVSGVVGTVVPIAGSAIKGMNDGHDASNPVTAPVDTTGAGGIANTAGMGSTQGGTSASGDTGSTGTQGFGGFGGNVVGMPPSNGAPPPPLAPPPPPPPQGLAPTFAPVAGGPAMGGYGGPLQPKRTGFG